VSKPLPVHEKIATRLSVETATRALSSLYVALVVLFAIYVVWIAFDTHYTTPTRDDWRILDDMFSSSILDWILRDQNGHRFPLTLSLMYVDYTSFGGHMHLPVLASVLWTSIAVAYLARAPYSQGLSPDPLARTAVAFACFLFLWAASKHDLGWGVNQGTLLSALLAVVSVGALGAAVRAKLDDGAPGMLPLLGAIAAAIGSTFSSGVGFACWAGLFSVTLLIPLSARAIAAVWVCAYAVLAIYLTGLEGSFNSPADAFLMRLLNSPGRLFEFALAYIGAPAATLISDIPKADAYKFATAAGAIGFAGYISLVLYLVIRRDKMTPLHVFAIGLPSVAFAGGLMVALNRLNWPHFPALAIRFSTWSVLFWIGLAFAIPSVRRRPDFRPGWPSLIGTVLLVGLSVLLLPEFREQRDVQAARKSRNAYASTMYVLGIRWDRMADDSLGNTPELTYRVIERLRQDRRSFFAEPRASWVGRPVTDNFKLADDNRCTGDVSWTQLVGTREGKVIRLSGWAIDHKRDASIEQILIADRQGFVRGLGVSVRRDADLGKTSLPSEDYPWAGFLRPLIGHKPFRAYGVLDGSLICDLELKATAIQ
jgi:hypothetical protein